MLGPSTKRPFATPMYLLHWFSARARCYLGPDGRLFCKISLWCLHLEECVVVREFKQWVKACLEGETQHQILTSKGSFIATLSNWNLLNVCQDLSSHTCNLRHVIKCMAGDSDWSCPVLLGNRDVNVGLRHCWRSYEGVFSGGFKGM